MSTKRLEHLKEWDKIYLEVEKVTTKYDDEKSLVFKRAKMWFDDLKQLANDGMPKQEVEWTLLEEKLLHSLWLHKKLPIQWERVEIRAVHQWTTSTWDEAMFVCFFLNKPLVKFDDDTFDVFDEWRFPPQKTELTLAEVEKRLGLDAWSLIIK